MLDNLLTSLGQKGDIIQLSYKSYKDDLKIQLEKLRTRPLKSRKQTKPKTPKTILLSRLLNRVQHSSIDKHRIHEKKRS